MTEKETREKETRDLLKRTATAVRKTNPALAKSITDYLKKTAPKKP